MKIKLCRTCGKSGQNFIDIFRTEGLRNKIETCLPITVSEDCLLPDTLCPECHTSIESFYIFTKNCLQNIIILETQLNIQDSCLKSKRRKNKSCSASLPFPNENKFVQTEDYLDVLVGNDFLDKFPLTNNFLNKNYQPNSIVDYEVESSNDSSDETEESGQVIFGDKLEGLKIINDFIRNVITSKKNLSQKRKSDSFEDYYSSDTSKKENSNKRKCNKQNESLENIKIKQEDNLDDSETYNNGEKRCLLCNVQLDSLSSLAEHFMKVHTKEANQSGLDSSSGESCIEKRKQRSIPSLVKISDLRKNDLIDNDQDDSSSNQLNINCPNSNCQTSFQTKSELFVHLRLNHSEISNYLCGICLKQTNSITNLKLHVSDCKKIQPPTNRYFCQICCFGDDNYRSMESHILVHNFLWKNCQMEMRIFDPEDYIQFNNNFIANGASPLKNFSCIECNRSDFDSFRKFAVHQRSVHSIFHCDLCNKFYGRSSHLWKHVNRLHKNHPSITCQVCFKTSASKYHLAQHFAKLHQTKTTIKKETCEYVEEKVDLPQDSTKNQDSTDQENYISSYDENSLNQSSQSDADDNSMDKKVAPKELDPSHDLYTNILTNYSPKSSEGNFECPKCSKRFLKRMLLRKHKKNCRPKLQKDLLTRCKSCSRIFKDRQSLAKHLTNYHSDYECEICTEKVQSKCGIVSHIRFQHPSSHLICSVCENILRCKKDLLEHLADHENSFICQFCGDALDSKVKLKMHILSLHRKILSLSCGICLKLFETQYVLRNHVMLIHKDQLLPSISCSICGKNYGSKWKTYDHINKSHGRFFKACKVCLEIYESEDQLESHLKSVHPNYQTTSTTSKLNPVAIMRASIKLEVPHLKVDKNEDNFDTDNEGNTEETENSQTSASEDDEQNEVVEDKKPTSILDQENKISLLEKRLLGNNMILEKNQTSKSSYKLLLNSSDEFMKEEKFITKNKEVKKSEHHPKRTVYENSNDPSFCEVCHKGWPAKKHLWQHYIRCHKHVAATVCGICLKTNKTYEDLQIHLRETHPTLLHGQGFGSNFICRICGRYHNASSKLRLHMVIHEKFDWSLMEKFPPILKTNDKKVIRKIHVKPNGKDGKVHKEAIISNENNEEMYDAMIEQVEESTCSTTEFENTQEESNQSNDTQESHKPNNQLTFSNFLQTLKNHNQFDVVNQLESSAKENITRSESVICVIGPKTQNFKEDVTKNIHNTSRSYLSEETSSSVNDSSQDGENQLQTERKDDPYYNKNVFRSEPEELDSAIKSISDPNNQAAMKPNFADFNESVQQGNCLNETEIESAVGSIL